MFQLAYCTAQALGIADQWHDAMFDAVWNTGELAVIDPATNRPKGRLPTIEDAARFYERHAGVPAAKFLGKTEGAASFGVDSKVRTDEALLAGWWPKRVIECALPAAAGRAHEYIATALGIAFQLDRARIFPVRKEAARGRPVGVRAGNDDLPVFHSQRGCAGRDWISTDGRTLFL